MKRKAIITAAALVLLLCAAVGGTLAWMTAQTDPVTNTFEAGKVTTYVNETFNGQTKTNVTVQNTGSIKAYIRAAIVVNWADASGNVCGVAPVENTDYSIDLYNGGWERIGNYYYCTSVIEPGNSTPVLIEECKLKDDVTPPTGYNLQVTILAEGIQAMPDDAIEEAWGVYPSNNWSTTAPTPPAEGEGGGTR